MAANDNFTVDAGATFRRTYIYKDSLGAPINLTGFTAKAQVRFTPTRVLLFEVTPTITALEGKIEMVWSATQTGEMIESTYVWGMELYNGSEVINLVYGTVTVNPQIVRE